MDTGSVANAVMACCLKWGPPLITGSLAAYVTATDSTTTIGDALMTGTIAFGAGAVFPALAVIAPAAYIGKRMADRRRTA